MMKGQFSVQTKQQTEFVDITEKVDRAVREAEVADGVLYLYNPHTTAGITINEGADPAVQRDVLAVLNKIVPWEYPYKHLEGNSPAHIKASLVGCSTMVFLDAGRLVLGTWQRIFFCEFDGGRMRKVLWRFLPG